MTIVLRRDSDHDLTADEIDDNFVDVQAQLDALTAAFPDQLTITSATVVGNVLTFVFSDLSTFNVTLPTATWEPLGPWLPQTTYTKFKVLTNAGSLYLTIFNHTSAASFDPNANDGSGHNYYSLILSPTSTPNDLHAFVGGAMSDNQLILRYQATRRFQMPQDLVGSLFAASFAATDDAVIELQRNGILIGNLTWVGGGSVVPTVDFAASITFDPTDVFTIQGPATADITLTDATFDILANRIP